MPEPLALPILDTHHHLWDLSRFRLPWLDGAPKLNRSFLMEDYLEATAGLGVTKTVYMEVDVEPSQQAQEAEHVFALCERGDNPIVAAVISGRPAAPDFGGYLDRFRGV
ncbi:MAG TPA: amidohydrolase, partial [Armatimonadota bacterium]|nr:amidohydrolase [Armatimonadota bacterium]